MSNKQSWPVPRPCGVAAMSVAAAVVVGGLAAAPAAAAVTLSIADVQVQAGQTAYVHVYASSTAGDVISGFNLPLDYNDDGFVDRNGDGVGDLPAGFALAAMPIANATYGNTGFDTPQPQISLINVDGIPTGSGQNLTLTTARTLLFDLAITVAPTVAVGTVVPLEIEVPAAPFGPLFNVAGPFSPTVAAPTAGAPVFGSIRVVGVPEPAAAAAVTLVLPLARRRRRPTR